MAETKKPTTKKIVKKATGLSLPTLSLKGESASVVVSPGLFDVRTSSQLLAQYVRVFIAGKKTSRAHAKSRGEVTGSSRKIYKQKGTGRARHGDRQAPIFVGGGKAHGPKGISRTLTLNKKQRQKALLSALTLKREKEALFVSPELAKIGGKTKELVPLVILASKDNKKVLFITSTKDNTMVSRSVANLPMATARLAGALNAYEVMRAGSVVFSPSALEEFSSLKSKTA